MLANAQYYYGNPYMTPEAMQNAYEYGRRLAQEQQAQNQYAYNFGKGMACVDQGKADLGDGNYEDALAKFEQAYEYNYMPGYFWAGLCYELGIGTEVDCVWAYALYGQGAQKNDASCKAAINRIDNYGYYGEADRETLLTAAQNARQSQSNSSGYTGGGYYNGGNSGNNGSNSTYSTCRICGGTGVCTSCHGTGGEWRDTGYYTGSNSKSWISCPSCNGSKRCFNCHGTGKQ